MRTRRALLVLALILVLAGVWAWRFLGAGSAQPATAAKVATLASTSVKPLVLKSALAVAAPQAAPVNPGDAPPAQFTPEDKKWLEDDIKSSEQVMPMLKEMAAEAIARTPDDTARAWEEQFEESYMAKLQKRTDLLRHAKPPTDLGEVVVSGLPQATGQMEAPGASKYVLSGGESFTVSLWYTSYWSLLITEDVPGATGPYAGKYFYRLETGKPIILMMQDGALAKFTLTGTLPAAPANRNYEAGDPTQTGMASIPARSGGN